MALSDFVIEHSSPLAAWGQVTRDLRQKIDQGLIGSGAKLPTERELTEQYGVSRITVRQALDKLSQDGYIQRRQGSGTYVSDRTTLVQHDLRLTTPWRDRLVSAGHTAVSRAIETTTDAVLPDYLRRELYLPEELGAMTYSKRLQLVDDTPIGITQSWIPTALAPGLADEPLIDGSLSTTLRARYGLEADSVDNYLAVGIATSAEAELLSSYLDVPLFVVTAASHTTDGALLEISRTSWLGSRVRFHYDRESASSLTV